MTPKHIDAANKLEEMLPHLKEIVREIRNHDVDAYATLYDARRRLGRIVASLGAGIPTKDCVTHDWESD